MLSLIKKVPVVTLFDGIFILFYFFYYYYGAKSLRQFLLRLLVGFPEMLSKLRARFNGFYWRGRNEEFLNRRSYYLHGLNF